MISLGKQITTLSNNINLLYVEDDLETQEEMQKILKIFSFNIYTATNGQGALEQYNNHNIDLIITDIAMPFMNGLEMIASIREKDQDIPILIFTAYERAEWFTQAINLGVDGFILKPFEFNNFERVLYKVLKHIHLNKKLKENQKALKDLNLTLEKKVQTALEKLKEERINHEQELIKNTKLATIGSMAAGITHEINTPLTYLKGVAEMSKYDIQNISDEHLQKNLLNDNQIILDGLNRMSIIVKSMHELAHAAPDTKEVSNVYSTLINVLFMLYNRSKLVSKIYINNEYFDPQIAIKDKYKFYSNINIQRIEQVWIIILNNALDELIKIDDYTTRRIDISIVKKDAHIIIEFLDNAGGIPKNLLAKIFEPFVSTKESSGIGIGLNVAKKIIVDHQGTIEANNTCDGAKFTVVMPLYV